MEATINKAMKTSVSHVSMVRRKTPPQTSTLRTRYNRAVFSPLAHLKTAHRDSDSCWWADKWANDILILTDAASKNVSVHTSRPIGIPISRQDPNTVRLKIRVHHLVASVKITCGPHTFMSTKVYLHAGLKGICSIQLMFYFGPGTSGHKQWRKNRAWWEWYPMTS